MGIARAFVGVNLAMGLAAAVAAQQAPNLTTTPSHTPSPTVTPTHTATPRPPVTPKPTPWVAGSPELAVSSDTSHSKGSPVVALRADGDFVVAWTGYNQDGDSGGIFARRFDASGSPLGGDFQVNTTTTSLQFEPAIASDSAGNFVVAWSSVAPDEHTDVFARRYDSTGAPLGGEFQVNGYATGYQDGPSVAMDDSGFVVVWESRPVQGFGDPGQDGDQGGVYWRRYDSAGNALTGDVLVNTTTTGGQGEPSVSMNTSGQTVVAWQSGGQDGDQTGIFAQRFDAAGGPVAGEFQVNTYTTAYQSYPHVSVGQAGDFVVVWRSDGEDGSSGGVFARAYNLEGSPVAPGLQVNTYTTSSQHSPRVAKDPTFPGGMVAVWESAGQDDPTAPGLPGVYAQRFDNAPAATAAFYLTQPPPRRGPEYRVNVYTTGYQYEPDVAFGADGRFVIVWSSFEGGVSNPGIFARRFNPAAAGPMHVDQHPSGGASNVNGVLEAGERVKVEPSWRNFLEAPGPLPLSGAASNLLSPADGPDSIDDALADYGLIGAGATNDCFTATGNCDEMSVSGARPAQHWDATFDEAIASTGPLGAVPAMTKTWSLHVGGSFPDVPEDTFYPFIENLFHNGVTAGGGCGAGLYCGEDDVLRQQMAVFLVKAAYGSSFVPPPATGSVFVDVPAASPFAAWIEELVQLGVAAGCGGGNFCPTAVVTRQQMAVFLGKTLWGSGFQGTPCSGTFEDVDCVTNPFANYIEWLYQNGIAAGCQANPPLYCPTDSTKRKQMAAFLVKTFGLQLYGAD